MSGWVIGYLVGGAVVVVVVVVLLLMIAGAKRIVSRAEDIVAGLEDAKANTEGLWAVRETNTAVTRITEGAAAARESLEGGDR